MKTEKELRKEVDKNIQEKVSALIKAFNDSRDQQLLSLVSLYEELGKLQEKKKELIAEQEKESKNFIPSNNVLNECSRKLHYTEGNIRGIQKQIDKII